jgi:pimeloyl-ACP methyl ester carboxylesterase
VLCMCAVLAPWVVAQSSNGIPGSLLMPESSLPAKRSVAVFGQKIAYYDSGTGPVVVLVHGFGSQAQFDWGNVLLPLAEKHRVLALDQIGFGSSDKHFIDYSIPTYVDFLGEFLRTLNVYEFTLSGESMGGWISALYIIESLAPENNGPHALPTPQRLILEDAAGMAALPTGPITVPGTLADAHGVAIVFHDKSRVTEEFVREDWAMQLKANDGFTKRSIWGNPKVATEVVGDRLAKITVPRWSCGEAAMRSFHWRRDAPTHRAFPAQSCRSFRSRAMVTRWRSRPHSWTSCFRLSTAPSER